MKSKVFFAASVSLYGVPPEHRAANGCKQFNVVCLTTSKKRLAELLNTKVKWLNHYGCRVMDQPRFVEQAGALDEIRYEVPKPSEHHGWHTYKPNV